MVIKDPSDAEIDVASLNDLRDTLRHLREKIFALRNHCKYHITNNDQVRDARNGTIVSTTELEDIIKMITTKLKT
jgi:hypothetical protein